MRKDREKLYMGNLLLKKWKFVDLRGELASGYPAPRTQI